MTTLESQPVPLSSWSQATLSVMLDWASAASTTLSPYHSYLPVAEPDMAGPSSPSGVKSNIPAIIVTPPIPDHSSPFSSSRSSTYDFDLQVIETERLASRSRRMRRSNPFGVYIPPPEPTYVWDRGDADKLGYGLVSTPVPLTVLESMEMELGAASGSGSTAMKRSSRSSRLNEFSAPSNSGCSAKIKPTSSLLEVVVLALGLSACPMTSTLSTSLSAPSSPSHSIPRLHGRPRAPRRPAHGRRPPVVFFFLLLFTSLLASAGLYARLPSDDAGSAMVGLRLAPRYLGVEEEVYGSADAAGELRRRSYVYVEAQEE